jgi:hypothetical protein
MYAKKENYLEHSILSKTDRASHSLSNVQKPYIQKFH